jgi:cytochrome c-type biogenesis protein CcmF
MLGSIILTIALAFSVISMIMYFLNYRGYKNALNYGRIAYHAMAILVIFAAAVLWQAIITHQYQYHYVYNYSNNSLKPGFLIASFWGGQEGSFTLWLLLTSIVGIILQSYTSKRGDLEPRVMAVFTLATTFLLVMVSPWFKNPFEYIWTTPVFLSAGSVNPQFMNLPFVQQFFFTDQSSNQGFIKMGSELHQLLANAGISVNQFIIDGKGLNPQLLNFWMQIHPPTLFTGFSMATVPFAFAIAALLKNDYRDWVKQSFPWVLAGAGILGLGIMMGGYWAYEMLGWGGYWAWDPVENSSLIPWLVGVSSVHTLLVQRKSQSKGGIGKYARTNLILCILTYVLVLYSTFLTRSGVLGDASVHSFVDPGMVVYLFLILFIGTFIFLGFGMIAYRWKSLSENIKDEENFLARELALFTAAIALIASATIVLVGTSAPIFGHAVDTFFYNEMHLPLAIIIMFLNGISLLIKWKSSNLNEVIKKSAFAAAGSIIFTLVVIIFGGVSQFLIILLSLAASFALLVNLDIAIKIVRGNKKMLGAYVSHIGIAVFLLGVIGSAVYGRQVDVDLVKDEPQEAFGYKMIFTGYHPIENNTKYAFNIDITRGNSKYNVKPVMYISDFNNSLMREPAILTLLTQDLYFSPLGYDEGNSKEEGGKTIPVKLGSEIEFENAKIKYVEFKKPDVSAMTSGGNIEMGTRLEVTKDGKSYEITPLIKRESNQFQFIPAEIKELNLKVEVKKIDPSSETADLIISKIENKEPQMSAKPKEVLTVTASVKPFISFVWIGVVIMVLGFFVSVARRLKESMIVS